MERYITHMEASGACGFLYVHTEEFKNNPHGEFLTF